LTDPHVKLPRNGFHTPVNELREWHSRAPGVLRGYVMALPDNPAPLLALVAAALFGMSTVVAKKVVAHTDSYTGALVSMGFSTLFYAAATPWFLGAWRWDWAAMGAFALVGTVRPFLSLNFTFEGTRRLGPTISGTVASTTPLFGSFIAILLLGERLTPPVAVATAGVVAGVAVFSWRGSTPRDWSAWALLFPIGAAFMRGVAQPVARYGFRFVPNPFLAGLTAYAVGFAEAVAFSALRAPRMRLRIGAWGAFWAALSGLSSGVAFLLVLLALEREDVVVIGPIVASNPVFTWLYRLMAWDADTRSPQVLLGLVLVVGSVMLITAGR